MKQKILTQAIAIFVALTSTTISLHGQVTIGSDQSANPGALLDLKMNGAATTKGLVLPRVNLTDKDNLFPMFISGSPEYSGANKTTEDSKHVGLTVYNTNKCIMGGKGVYLWDGSQWSRLPNDGPIGSIFFNQDYFDLPSGKDARPLTTQPLTVRWDMSGSLSYSISNTIGGGVPFSGANALPASPWTVNPMNINLLPDAMSNADVPNGNPWKVKESQLIFTDTDCGNTTKTITLNQTNYALKVNNQFINTQINFTTPLNTNFTVDGNVAWTTSIGGVLAGSMTVTPTTGGTDLKDGTHSASTIQYTISGGNKYDSGNITFKDTQPTKRINDITVTLVNCNDTQEPTLKEWAKKAGFPNVNNPKVSNADDIAAGINTPHPTSTVAWHRDQDENIFLSADFGSAGRWMIVNLGVKKYDPIRTDGSSSSVAQSTILTNTYDTNDPLHYYTPTWAYPNDYSSGRGPSDPYAYNINQRYGFIYNWAAASLKRGGSNGKGTVNEEGTNHAKVQGICPNGWHLPSDYEWFILNNEVQANTSTYSSMSDIGGEIRTPAPTVDPPYKDNPVGSALKEPCVSGAGASNMISSTIHSGFFAVAVGTGFKGMAPNVGISSSSASWWTSSSYYTPGYYGAKTWRLYMSGASAAIFQRGASERYIMQTVRCKKD